MPIFTAVAAAVSAAVGGGLFGAIAGFAARTLLTVGITKLIANRAGKTAAGTQDAGSRVQLPPASNNKVPVVYGTAYMSPVITDAKISSDQKTMWYVCTLAEVSNSMPGQTPDTYTFGDIYWGGKKVVFDGSNTAQVIRLETNEATPQYDDKVNGKIYIYKFPNGSSSGISAGGSNAITLLSDAGIPADQRWDSALYTSNGQSAQMDNLAFLVVKVVYDTNAGTQRLETMNVEITNSRYRPGEVLKDYMINERYGCAIKEDDIDLDSIATLNDYSDELIDFKPVGWVTGDPYQTQPRYRINGPVNTGQNCLNNLQELVDACDSWLQYSELSGKWTIVVNKPYDWDGSTLADLYQVTNNNLISGINVNPIDLNNAYNQLEVQFPDNGVNDQTRYRVINLVDFAPEVMSPNEPQNKLTVQFPQVNNYIQASYIGLRRMLQSREDLVIDFTLDYSGIQVVAGDVICIPFDPYGWEVQNSGYGKLFRVSQVQEAKLDDGSLGARITAFEYNQTIYADDPIQDYTESPNTGLADPSIIGTPEAPTAILDKAGTISQIKVTGKVPYVGQVLYMDFNVGNSSNSATHTFYTTVKQSNGAPYDGNSIVTINSTDLLGGTYYWSMTARNDLAGVRGPSSDGVVWAGPNVTAYTTTNFVCAYSTGNVITVAESIGNITAGMSVVKTGGTGGTLAANTVVVEVTGAHTFTVDPAPVVDLVCANLTVTGGGIADDNIKPSGVVAGTYHNATVTVNSKGIVTNAANGNATINLGTVNWSILNAAGGNIILPVNAYSTSTRNIPIYFYGTGVDELNTYPWAQGTANSSAGTNGNNYYASSSTSAYEPYGAGFLLISDGDDNWINIINDSSMAGHLTSSDIYGMDYGFTMVSDTIGTLVQIVEGIEENYNGYYQCSTDQLETLELSPNLPQSFVKTKFFSNPANVTSAGSFVRVLTEGANVTFTQATLRSSKNI